MGRTNKKMPTVPAKLTRLEVIIIAAALMVLLLGKQPPQSGNADVRSDAEPRANGVQAPIPAASSELLQSPHATAQPADPGFQSPFATETDNLTPDPIPQMQPKSKRYAMVDARKCDSLKYPDVMYGQITVRWVWDGSRLAPQKVCEVKEANGIVSVWSFNEQHEGVTLQEIPENQVPPRWMN